VDPWAWLTVAGVLPLLVHSLGAPLGEPVAEDFDFLRRALLEGPLTPFDGGGSQAFWRPVAHQLYYATLGPLILSHPLAVPVIHGALLALAALLLYRALRSVWPAPLACAAALFPLLAESTRTLVSWPSHFVDLGLFLFSALALHEASRRRLATALAALLAALLCKELAVVTAVLLPWMPAAQRRGRGERVRWALASGALVAAWAVAYLAIRRHAGLQLPLGLEHDPGLLATPLRVRLAWALRESLLAVFSLNSLVGARRIAGMLAATGLPAIAAIVFAASGAARRRLRRSLPWTAWGLGWFLFSSAALTTIYPLWQPNRSQFGSLGLGVGLTAALGAAHPSLAAALLATRLALFAASPGPPARVTREAPETGAFLDFERLVRLQRLMRETRTALRTRFPTLPHGARIAYHYLPRNAEYAFGGSKALQVWYGDTTLRWIDLPEFSRESGRPVAGLLEFQPAGSPQMAFVDPGAMREYLEGVGLDLEGRPAEALRDLERADSLQGSPSAAIFSGMVASERALALLELERVPEAERAARAGAALWPGNISSQFVLGSVLYRRGELDEAAAHVDSVLQLEPQDANTLRLRDAIREARARR
jgi:tetratricopeptide (TPR) repeat protein